MRLKFQLDRKLDVPNMSACILAPDWQHSRFSHYWKGAKLLKQLKADVLLDWHELVHKTARIFKFNPMGDEVLPMTIAGSAAGSPAAFHPRPQAAVVAS